MKTLIVGIGALGGLIAARFRAAGLPVWLATRDTEQADRLRASGLRVTGMGGAVAVQATAISGKAREQCVDVRRLDPNSRSSRNDGIAQVEKLIASSAAR